MANAIDFYFDYSSPYGYFAAMKIEGIAAKHGRGVNWKPILLGAVFKVTGAQPLPTLLSPARHPRTRSRPAAERRRYLNWKLARSCEKVGLKTTVSRSIALETKVGAVLVP